MLLALVLLSAATTQASPAPAFDLGPSIGQALPGFEAPDQDGRLRTFGNLTGPSGLVLVFFRSADW